MAVGVEPYQQLETEFAAWAGVQNPVACATGTAALHLALEAMQLPPGSEVIVPDYTMVACARAVTLAGLVPVFVDCSKDLLIDPTLVADAVSPRTSAIMAVHVYGRRCDVGQLVQIAKSSGLKLIEDSAEAHGVPPHLWTDAVCWSFYRNKIVAGEEGGLVAFRDAKHAALARKLRCIGMESDSYVHVPRGCSYRMSNAQALMVLESLRCVTTNQQRRRRIEQRLDESCPTEWKMPHREAVWVYDMQLRAGRDRALNALKAMGIPARPGFVPMHAQAEYRKCKAIGYGACEAASRSMLYLCIDPRAAAPVDAFEVISRAVRR